MQTDAFDHVECAFQHLVGWALAQGWMPQIHREGEGSTVLCHPRSIEEAVTFADQSAPKGYLRLANEEGYLVAGVFYNLREQDPLRRVLYYWDLFAVTRQWRRQYELDNGIT